MVAHVMDLALVTRLYELLHVLVEERPPELFQELHVDGVNLLVAVIFNLAWTCLCTS
jgi:hypothetical protein